MQQFGYLVFGKNRKNKGPKDNIIIRLPTCKVKVPVLLRIGDGRLKNKNSNCFQEINQIRLHICSQFPARRIVKMYIFLSQFLPDHELTTDLPQASAGLTHLIQVPDRKIHVVQYCYNQFRREIKKVGHFIVPWCHFFFIHISVWNKKMILNGDTRNQYLTSTLPPPPLCVGHGLSPVCWEG